MSIRTYFVGVVLLFVVVKCNITINGPVCGQKVCKRGEYCGQHQFSCESCSKICNESTHNYEKNLCESSCQDYLHDNRYVVKDESGNNDENLRATVQRLSAMVTVTLTLVCLMLVTLATVLIFQLYRWKKKKNITLATFKSKLFFKKSDSPANKTPATNGEKPDLRLEIPVESVHSSNSPATMTTSISRRPAEDDTQDYAYDNPAMTNSPGNKTGPQF